MKKVIIISLSMLVIIGLLTGCGKKKETQGNNPQEEIKVNNNEEVIKDQEVEVFKFEQTSLIYENNNSKLVTKVTNNSDQVQEIVEFRIHVMNGDEEIVNLPGFIGDALEPGESRLLTSVYGSDLTGATSIKYEVVR